MTDAVTLFAELVGYEVRVYGAVDDALQRAHGLTAAQFAVLRLVGRGSARTVGEVAAQIPITVGAASKGVDRLEATGWVARSPNPANRRSSLLELTDAGRSLLQGAQATAEGLLTRLMAEPLGERRGSQFAGALEVLRAALSDAPPTDER